MPTIDIVKILENTGVLKHKGPQTFINEENFPWINIACVNSNKGNFAQNDSDSTEVCNLIAIVVSRQGASNEIKYVELLKHIAAKLNWELILEEDDDGNENVVLN
ncbi:MAG: hypothetical protein ACXVI9_12085 [Mucilaginibacter sp.]